MSDTRGNCCGLHGNLQLQPWLSFLKTTHSELLVKYCSIAKGNLGPILTYFHLWTVINLAALLQWNTIDVNIRGLCIGGWFWRAELSVRRLIDKPEFPCLHTVHYGQMTYSVYRGRHQSVVQPRAWLSVITQYSVMLLRALWLRYAGCRPNHVLSVRSSDLLQSR